MNQLFRITAATVLAMALALPAGAETPDKSDEKDKTESFLSKLAEVADEAAKETIEKNADDTESTGSEKANEGKKSASKKADKSDASDKKKTAKGKDKDKNTSITELVKSSDSKTKAIKGSKVLVMPISGSIEERGDEMVLFGEQPESLKRYIDTLRRARLDDSIKQVVLRIGPNDLGMATGQELREAIDELQKRKKTVTAILEDDSQASYLTAIAADEVVMPPSAELMLHGVSADSYFLKNLLSKLGVKVQIIHVGQYKSYGETFTQDDFTSFNR